MLKDDFDVLQVNYSMLPDLNVGDGDIQVVVANADLAKSGALVSNVSGTVSDRWKRNSRLSHY